MERVRACLFICECLGVCVCVCGWLGKTREKVLDLIAPDIKMVPPSVDTKHINKVK